MNNTQRITNRIGFLLPLFYVTAPILAVMRSKACIEDMDTTGYFGDSPLITACNIAMVILTVIFFTHAFSHHRKDSVPKEGFCNPPTYITSATLAVGISFAIYDLISALVNSNGRIGEIESGEIIMIVSAATGIMSLAFLLLNAIIEARLSQLKAALGIATSIFFSTYGIYVYLDKSVAANMQQRVATVLALLLMASFMLFEARIPLGHSKWHSYAAFGFMAGLALIYSSVPAIAYYFAKGMEMPGSTLIQTELSFVCAIYVITRVSILAFAPEDEICDLTDSILDMVHRRVKN